MRRTSLSLTGALAIFAGALAVASGPPEQEAEPPEASRHREPGVRITAKKLGRLGPQVPASYHRRYLEPGRTIRLLAPKRGSQGLWMALYPNTLGGITIVEPAQLLSTTGDDPEPDPGEAPYLVMQKNGRRQAIMGFVPDRFRTVRAVVPKHGFTVKRRIREGGFVFSLREPGRVVRVTLRASHGRDATYKLVDRSVPR